MNKNSIIIPLSYPDTLIKQAKTKGGKFMEIFSNKGVFKIGHSALLLIKFNDAKIQYFDFGRYICPYKYGRVRNEFHDCELEIPIKAKWKNGKIVNKEEILIYIEKISHLTHGDGKLIASFSTKINYDIAYDHIQNLINKGMIVYDIFGKTTTNCSRFVADTIYKSTSSKRIKFRINILRIITPSPLGVVISSANSSIYKVMAGKIETISRRYRVSMLKDFIIKNYDINNVTSKEKPNTASPFKNGQWLGAIGAGAWFTLKHVNDNIYIGEKSIHGGNNFSHEFISEKYIDLDKKYTITYPSNTQFFSVIQNGETIKLFKK